MVFDCSLAQLFLGLLLAEYLQLLVRLRFADDLQLIAGSQSAYSTQLFLCLQSAYELLLLVRRQRLSTYSWLFDDDGKLLAGFSHYLMLAGEHMLVPFASTLVLMLLRLPLVPLRELMLVLILAFVLLCLFPISSSLLIHDTFSLCF